MGARAPAPAVELSQPLERQKGTVVASRRSRHVVVPELAAGGSLRLSASYSPLRRNISAPPATQTWVTSGDWIVTAWTDGAFGWSTDEAIGRRSDELHGSVGIVHAAARYWVQLTGAWQAPSLWFGKNEVPVFGYVRAVAICDADGEIIGYRGSISPLG